MEAAEFLAHGARFALALLLAAAGAAKAVNLGDFRVAVANYGLLPAPLVRPVATAVPAAELLAAALLLTGTAPHLAGAGTAALLLALTAAVVINLARGRILDCGCFGAAAPRRLTWWTVARNLVLVGMAAGVAVGRPGGLAVWAGTGAGGPPLPSHEVITTAALALVGVTAALTMLQASTVRRRARTLAGLASGAR